MEYYPRYLTREIYREWVDKANPPNKRRGLYLEWRHFEKSEYLKQRFLNWPVDQQRHLTKLLILLTPVETVEMYYRDFDRLDEKYPKIDLLAMIDLELANKLLEIAGSPSKDFLEEANSLMKFQRRNDKSSIVVCGTYPLILRALYGEKKVIEVMQQWRKNTVTSKLHLFGKLVRNWDELKDYPADWSISLID